MKILFSLFTAVLLLTACSPRVTTVNPAATDLSDYKTYAYLPNADIEMQDGNMDQKQVNQRIVDATKRQMDRKGFELDRDNPDLLLLISVKRDQEVAVDTDPVYATYPYATYGVNTVSPYYNNYYYNDFYGYTDVVGYDTDTYQYTEGTLVINLIDRKTRETVWKGYTSDAIYSGGTTGEIVELVDDIFEEMPSQRMAR
jgi:hypothetical protein